MADHQHNKHINSESGNAFFIVMVGVVLFGALMFTFSRGARQGGDNLTEKQAGIAASDIITYAQKVERGVQRVYGRGYSENSISFVNSFYSGHENAACTDPRCEVFSSRGGGVGFKRLEGDWSLSATNWIYNGNNQVMGIGRDCNNASCVELLMLLEDVPLSLCTAINEQIGLTSNNVPPPADGDIDTVLFTSTFSYNATNDLGDGATELDGVRTGCFLDNASGDYYFYHVLLER